MCPDLGATPDCARAGSKLGTQPFTKTETRANQMRTTRTRRRSIQNDPVHACVHFTAPIAGITSL
eukprot:2971506-Lingulodinium_polyedra.AAC.1